MKHLFIFFFILSFCIPSCINDAEDNRRFRGDRNKSELSGKRKRTTKFSEKESSQKENPQQASQENSNKGALVFPFSLSSEHTAIKLLIDEEHEKITVSAEPKEKPISLIAGFSGELSVTTNAETHTIAIHSKNNKILVFELSIENTKLLVANSVNIAQKEQIAESANPIVFYVKENEKLTILCLSVNKLSTTIKVIKNFTDHPDCNK